MKKKLPYGQSNYETLVNNDDLRLKIKIIDELSFKNSYHLSQYEN